MGWRRNFQCVWEEPWSTSGQGITGGWFLQTEIKTEYFVHYDRSRTTYLFFQKRNNRTRGIAYVALVIEDRIAQQDHNAHFNRKEREESKQSSHPTAPPRGCCQHSSKKRNSPLETPSLSSAVSSFLVDQQTSLSSIKSLLGPTRTRCQLSICNLLKNSKIWERTTLCSFVIFGPNGVHLANN